MDPITAETQHLERAGVTTGTNLTGYDLQLDARYLTENYLNAIPLQQHIPDVKGAGGVATNFKAITSINGAHIFAGLGEGHRNAANTTDVITRSIPYSTLGMDDFVTYEADDAARGWTNLTAGTQFRLMWATKLAKERQLLFGIGKAIGSDTGSLSGALGQGTVSTATASTTGGTLAAGTYSVYVMPLAYEALDAAGGYVDCGSVTTNFVIRTPYTRTNMGGTTDTIKGGAGQISAALTATTTGTTGSITATATSIAGCPAYAWFCGTSASTARLVAITALPTVKITATNSVGQLASVFVDIAADNSLDTLGFTGVIPYVANSPLSYKLDAGGSSLTTDGGRNIEQLNDAFFWLWRNYKTTYDTIWCSAKMASAIDQLVTKSANGQNNVVVALPSSSGAETSLNPIGRARMIPNVATNTNINIQVHPLLPDSMILLSTDTTPFPTGSVSSNSWEYHYQRALYAEEWPRTSRQYEYGVYTRGALALNSEMSFGLISNIGL